MCVVLIMNGRLCFNLNKAPNCSASPCQKFPFLLQTVVAFQLHCWLEWACSGEGGKWTCTHPSLPSDGGPWDPKIVRGVWTIRLTRHIFSTLHKTLLNFIYLFQKNVRQTVHHAQVPAGQLNTLNASKNSYCFLPLLAHYRETYIFLLAFPPWTCLNSHMERYKTGGLQLFMEQRAVNNTIQICKYSCWGNNFLN